MKNNYFNKNKGGAFVLLPYFYILLNFIFLLIPDRIIPIINNIGNMLENKIPIFILSLKILDNLPTIVGPSEHPTSPASAKKANSAVPPFFSIDEDILKVPGHKYQLKIHKYHSL